MDHSKIIHVFKSNWDGHPLKTLENKPEGALIIWGFGRKVYSQDMEPFDFQDYLDYVREAIEDVKK